MKRTIITICLTALITALGIAVAYSGILTPSTPAGTEGVAIVDPTDGNLQDLDKLAGGDVMSILPRGTKLAQHEIVRVKIKRARFMEARTAAANGRKVQDARQGMRSELRWYDLIGVPIETRLEGKRPMVTVVTINGSVIRSGRMMRVDDVKLVIITTDKQVKFIELI